MFPVRLHQHRARSHCRRASCTRNFLRPSLSISHDVAPEFREFERLSTTVVNAYLGPVMRGYIHRLGERLRDLRCVARRRI